VHELSLMQEILKVIEEQVRVNEVKKVHEVHLRVGKMMAVVPSSLCFCFEILSKGTMLEGAKLEIEEVPVRCKCKGCGGEFIVESFVFSCPDCKSGDLEQLSGNEFMVHSMEVD
jgi:hydrogenase nickel incorporation protein HypA/HybF